MVGEPGTSSPTRKLSQFIAQASYDQLPPEVSQSAKRYIMDSVANQIGGASLSPGRIILEMYQELGGKPESTILATGNRVPCLHATYVNAALSNLLDFDDCYLYGSHPGATIVPAALSLGEKLSASGREVINAVVLGYEVSLRVSQAIQATPQRTAQVWGMATWQIFGAVTAAAKLLHLTTEQVATALGHAGMSAPVPFVYKGGLYPDERPCSWLKNNFGWAAMGGVLAAMLAARDYQGIRHIFDGDKGFWVMAGSDQFDPDRLTSGLGQEYLMPLTGIKPYASCRWTHTALGALDELMEQNDIDPGQVGAICITSMTAMREFDVPRPADIIDAQFALPPLVALTLAGYPLTRGIADDHLNDRLVQDLIAKVKIEVDPDADRCFHDQHQMPATVTIEMMDGARFQNTHRVARGEPQLPLTDDELNAKFLQVTVPLVGEQRAQHMLSRIACLEELDDVATIPTG